MIFNETPGHWEDYHSEVAADTKSLITIVSDMDREEPENQTGRLHALSDILMHLDALNNLYMERIRLDLEEKHGNGQNTYDTEQ